MKELQNINGNVWYVGDNIDTDQIAPSHILTSQDKQEMLNATLEFVLPNFAQDVKKGDVILAGENFGTGSSREEAVYVLKELGIKAIIAKSFARIFFRNCINLGLPAITITNNKENKTVFNKVLQENKKATIHLKFSKGQFQIAKSTIQFTPFSEFIEKILQSGGILNSLI